MSFVLILSFVKVGMYFACFSINSCSKSKNNVMITVANYANQLWKNIVLGHNYYLSGTFMCRENSYLKINVKTLVIRYFSIKGWKYESQKTSWLCWCLQQSDNTNTKQLSGALAKLVFIDLFFLIFNID